MATVTIEFEFTDGSTDQSDFEADGLLVAAITEYADDAVEALNEDFDEDDEDAEEIDLVGWHVVDVDYDHADQQGPDDFKDLDAWGEYCEECDKHGNAYCLRYADVGDNDFEEDYCGCFDSFEDYARQFVDDCYNLDGPLASYFDYERFASDLEMDYSTYEDSDGVHVFRC